MAEDASIANRRLKLFLAWLASCFFLVVFHKWLGLDPAMITLYVENTTTATLVIIGGLSATDVVNSYAASRSGGKK